MHIYVYMCIYIHIYTHTVFKGAGQAPLARASSHHPGSSTINQLPPATGHKEETEVWCRGDGNTNRYLGGGNSSIFYFYPYLLKIPNLTNTFQRGWNHQLDTLTETNMAPENWWWEYDRFLLGWSIFRGELIVSGSLNGPHFGRDQTWLNNLW